jgi:SAM-dependent methyltransferase
MPVVGRLKDSATRRIHPEVIADNFSVSDCDLTFFSIVRAIKLRHGPKRILDYGAGRNGYQQDFDPSIQSYLIRDLRNLQSGEVHVTAVDVAPEVLSHPTSDQQFVIDPDGILPFDDNSFELIVSDYVFEHVENPYHVATELQRVLQPDGWLVVRTPNRLGYLKLAASLVPNRLHVAALKFIQPHRKAVDTFPTHYKLNSLRAIKRSFDKCEVVCITGSWEPAYFFGKTWLYRIFQLVHWIMPKRFGTAHIFIARKHS